MYSLSLLRVTNVAAGNSTALEPGNPAISAWRRWRVRNLVMLIVTGRFLKNRWIDTLMLLEQDGITGWKARWGLFKYLAVTPGVIRRLALPWLSYFKHGFHPWDHDDRALIGKYDGEFSDALMPAE